MPPQAQPPASGRSSQSAKPASPGSLKQGIDDQSHVQQFLDDMARHLTAGQANEVAKLWETPALVLSDTETRAVESPQAVVDFFSGAKEQYNSRGIIDTRAEIQHVYWVTDRIVMVEVRWPYIDAKGSEIGEESSTYVLRMDNEDRLRLRVSIMQGAKEAH
jgi:hypothetical protein